ncbi:PREDICTED: TATA element modulatory factor-like isoform X2 [Lupinus angustifolius]|uniref:TATA element modulatory factor-like isoform X2 n=1 Tax=Lupinus angustifolius TaxID=3871 RepID=UPI00092F197E|nr:PREDICTED: TATA element modulatory factor-like isoform X2 [Lupinus angustifolius]
MAKKKMSNQSKQQHQQQQQHEENVSQPQPTPSSDNNNKLETLKNLNSLLLKETTKRRQQVESLESHLSNTVDDNVVSELEKSVAFAFIKSRVEELGFVFSSDKNDMSHVVSELGFEVEELKNRLSEVSGERDRLKVDFDGVVVDAGLIKEKVREGEIREEKVVEELRKVRSEWEKLIEEGLKKEKVIEEVIGERDSAVSKWRELNEKLLEELQKVRLEGEKLIEEGGRKERVINEVTVERDSALSDSRELKEKVLEAENSNRKLLDELQKMRLEVENLLEEGSRKDRVIGEVTVERDLAVRDSRELKEKVLEAENSNKKLLEELQKVRLEGEKLIQEGSRKERVIGEVKVERDLAVRDSRELKEKLLEAENSNKRFLEELQKVRLEGEKLFEEGSRKDRLIGEVTSERESAVRSLRESTKVIEKLKEEIDLVTREKDEISKVNDAQKVKISSMELELVNVSEALNYVSKEEKLMKGKLLELEDKVGIYEKKEEGLMLKIRDLVKHKEEVEGSVEMLKEGRDSVEKVLGKVRKELEDKQREIENVKVSYVKEITEVQNIANELNQSGKGFEKKNSELLSEVESYKNAVKEVTVERDNIRKGFEEEKNKVKSLMLQVAEMEGKIEALAGEIGMIKSEKVKLLEKNETVESRVSVLIDEKDALQRSLLEAQQECDEVRAKVEFYSLNSNQVLEMLKNAAALVSQDMEGEEDVVSNEQKPEEEIRLYAEQLGAIRDAFRNKNKMVADMKQQSEVLQKSVHEAHQMKSLWTMISSGASVLAAAFAAAYVAKGH